MTSYLLTWNPEGFPWDSLDDTVQEIREKGESLDWWSTGATKQIAPSSLFYMMRLGGEPRGIIGSGTILTAPKPTPHWDQKRRESGAVALGVDVRFEALERLPIVRRHELNAPEFEGQQWDPQASGISINDGVASQLERLWSERIATPHPTAYHISKSLRAKWLARWEALKGDRAMEQHRGRDEQRRIVAPKIGELLNAFLVGEIDLATFRETFHRKTSNEWDVFGLKGLSGAMFLNKLAKHVPDQRAATAALQEVLTSPNDDDEARRRLDEFHAYLAGVVARGEASGSELQPKRAPFFVSACWHMLQRERWPPFYESARKAYKADGLFLDGPVTGDGYVEFASLTRALADALGVDIWTIEHICSEGFDVDEFPGPPESNPPPPVPRIDDEPRVWLYAPGQNAAEWEAFRTQGIAAIGWRQLGDLSKFRTKQEVVEKLQSLGKGAKTPTHSALACWEFAKEMQPGDVIFAKRGTKHIIGYGIVSSDYRHEPARGRYPNVRSVQWLKHGEWVAREKPLVTKTLTNIGGYTGLVAKIRTALDIDEDVPVIDDDDDDDLPAPPAAPLAPYSMTDALSDLFVDELWLTRAVQLLKHKHNLVLQGPPGVGKTFVARRLAYLLLGEKDPARVAKVQFHASYSYEDFIQGYRPEEGGGFGRIDGPFWSFCDDAQQDLERPYVFLIDEINRGNLSKIFGELLMLLEHDKRSRDWAVRLTYARAGEEDFFIPPNVFVIGTMNTADRSLAMVDYALRRRFAFVDLKPALASEAFDQHLARLGAGDGLRTTIRTRVEKLNDEIAGDRNLGPGFMIGHSYFCSIGGHAKADQAWFHQIIDTEIEPLLKEYWFDAPDKAMERAARLRED